jgi:hypothetical protein
MSRVIVSKYSDILPLHRQETISARDGFALPRSTQCGWLKAAHEVTAPVVDAMFADGKRTAFLIATDATSAPVLPSRGASPPTELRPVMFARACTTVGIDAPTYMELASDKEVPNLADLIEQFRNAISPESSARP